MKIIYKKNTEEKTTLTLTLDKGKESETINYPLDKENEALSQLYKWDNEFIGKNKRIWAKSPAKNYFGADEVIFTALYNEEDDIAYLLKQPEYFYKTDDDDEYDEGLDAEQYDEEYSPIVKKYKNISAAKLYNDKVCDSDYGSCGNNNDKVLAPGDNYFYLVKLIDGVSSSKESYSSFNFIQDYPYIEEIKKILPDNKAYSFSITIEKIEV